MCILYVRTGALSLFVTRRVLPRSGSTLHAPCGPCLLYITVSIAAINKASKGSMQRQAMFLSFNHTCVSARILCAMQRSVSLPWIGIPPHGLAAGLKYHVASACQV